LRLAIGRAGRNLASTTFDMDSYVDRLDQIGREAERLMQQFRDDFEAIRTDSDFDMFMSLEPYTTETTRDAAIRRFLARAGALATSTQPAANFIFRRPSAGFHPQIYVHENAKNYDAKTVNPLAHFIRAGKPPGPWRHDVIRPFTPDTDAAPTGGKAVSAAIHGHFYYPELLADFLDKLAVNDRRCDLLLSTDDETKAQELRRTAAGYTRGGVVIRIVPNRGRDIGAFLTGFADLISNYDVIGHVHSKRTLFIGDATVGESWREFLWQNLIGGIFPMMDQVLDRFAADPGLGLVFPEDPHLNDWDQNRAIAEELAARMGVTEPLPQFFDFPLGTMFWARPPALDPFMRLKLQWGDYPAEPLPPDGTMLHALERLLPFAARRDGYRYATTYVPALTW